MSDGEAGLAAFATRLHGALAAEDVATAAALVRAVYPSGERLGPALRPDAPSEEVAKIEAMYVELAPADGPDADRGWARVLAFPPGRSEVSVFGATTEEIAANEEGSVAWREFPGGAVAAAQSILAPGVTFYQLQFAEPGEERGTKFHLFFWDGRSWCMLGPVWRAAR